MIGKLKGLVEEINDTTALIDVGGVCYEVFCSSKTLNNLPAIGERTALIIETHVREDQIKLYGFGSVSEKDWFLTLTGVQGVGVRVGLAILSTLSLDELHIALVQGDKTMIGRTPGIGPKLAQRIVTELKDKVPSIDAADLGLPAQTGSQGKGGNTASEYKDAASALVNLGYNQSKVDVVMAKLAAENDETPSTQTLIRLGLRELAG